VRDGRRGGREDGSGGDGVLLGVGHEHRDVIEDQAGIALDALQDVVPDRLHLAHGAARAQNPEGAIAGGRAAIVATREGPLDAAEIGGLPRLTTSHRKWGVLEEAWIKEPLLELSPGRPGGAAPLVDDPCGVIVGGPR